MFACKSPRCIQTKPTFFENSNSHIPQLFSFASGLGQCKMQTADCRLRKMQTQGKMQTTDILSNTWMYRVILQLSADHKLDYLG